MPLLRRAAVPLLLWAVAAAYCWWRVPAAARDRIWAEDGAVFLNGSLSGAPPWRPYDGYLHVVPRLVTDAIALVVPAGRWDIAITLAAVALVALVCALTWLLTADVIERPWVRAVVALAPVLLPAGATEALGNLANLHGFGLWLAFWLVLHRPASRAAAIAWAVAGLLVGLTEVAVVLLVPLMVLGWRDRLRWIPRAGLITGALAQLLATLLQPRPDKGDAAFSLIDLVAGYAGHAGGAAWTDDGGLAGLLVDLVGPVGLVVLLLPALVAAGLALRGGGPGVRAAALGLMVGSVLLWTASIAANGYPMVFAGWSGDQWRAGGVLRYGASSGLYLFAVPLVVLDLARSRNQRVVAAGAALLVLAASLLAARPATVAREQGPPWPATAELVERCSAAAGTAPREIAVQIAPDLPGWRVVLPCDRVR
ncbi:hypothetical protein ACFFOS_04165 [Nocardioides kongjuensis]|uniref:DUF2029 domain-containing protein n=1 Tax=Nocardioides kongjuensis TaxID=349522 RepID=A0A852RJC2_9ACTN|nr:hypothetical protein [Nocardioides kongjuensis]NYD28970.1 hypothetical protein [Nocardioides kongjuensis]